MARRRRGIGAAWYGRAPRHKSTLAPDGPVGRMPHALDSECEAVLDEEGVATWRRRSRRTRSPRDRPAPRPKAPAAVRAARRARLCPRPTPARPRRASRPDDVT